VANILKIEKAAIVGWSDGAILGLDIAINHPERLTKLFAFAANSDPSGVKDIAQSEVFNAYIARAEKEYEKLSSSPTGTSPSSTRSARCGRPNRTGQPVSLKASKRRPG
jgi:pimeloyl-ACP methyl ester carboxylesterase